MGKFHINKQGKVAPCTAISKPCPLGGEGEHIVAASIEEAQVEFNKKFKEQNSILAGMNKEKQKSKENLVLENPNSYPISQNGLIVLSEHFGLKHETYDGELVVWNPNTDEFDNIEHQLAQEPMKKFIEQASKNPNFKYEYDGEGAFTVYFNFREPKIEESSNLEKHLYSDSNEYKVYYDSHNASGFHKNVWAKSYDEAKLIIGKYGVQVTGIVNETALEDYNKIYDEVLRTSWKEYP